MANAQVEKLKSAALRHGEKVLVAGATAVCLLCLFFATTKESIQITPEQVSKDAEAARSNLGRTQPREEIVESLDKEGIKNPGFASLVEAQEKDAPKASDYKVARSWVTTEPGAGLIRDTPALIAATELFAYPGRGAALVYEMVDGKRVPEDPAEKKEADPVQTIRRRKKRRNNSSMGMGSSSSSSMMMAMLPSNSGSAPPRTTDPAKMTPEEKKAFELEEKKRKALFAGKPGADVDDAKPEDADKEAPSKEITQGLRWVAITGVLDHQKLRDNYLAALKNPAVAHPNYKQLDVERQVKQVDGKWSEWTAVDVKKNHEISYNVPEEEEELTPETVRIGVLCDPLPFLKAGYWERVHVASLVPKEKREIEKPAPSSMMGSSSSMSSSMMMPPSSSMSSSMMMPSSSSMMMMGGSSSMGGGGAETTTFATTEAPAVMIRSLDFTVEPGASYRYRLRIVVFNPNYNREDVSPGTETKALTLEGDWSEPTNEVTMPADITAYAMKKQFAPPNAKRQDMVSFQIVKWNPEDGMTVTKTRDYGVGQIVGETIRTDVPVGDGTGTKSKPIDYNSHQLLIDEAGGDQPVSQVGVNGKLEVPALTLLLSTDGSVSVRNEAYDLADAVRKDMVDNYKREVDEANKQRESSNGSMPGTR